MKPITAKTVCFVATSVAVFRFYEYTIDKIDSTGIIVKLCFTTIKHDYVLNFFNF